MRPRVYIETTIPSFYYEIRDDPISVAQRDWTNKWWDLRRHEYDCVTSEAVLEELSAGDYPSKTQTITLVAPLPLLPIEPAIFEIVETYIRHRLMPADVTGDPLHLAVASYHKCDFLLTWNCRHLANANKFRHIQRVNTLLGLYVPDLVTPIQLLGEEA